jgi:hypothetical protein
MNTMMKGSIRKLSIIFSIFLFIVSFHSLHNRLSVARRELVKGYQDDIAIILKTTANPYYIPHNHTCLSLYKQQNRDNEHSPLVFRDFNLVVCRTPKVGSLELRGIAAALDANSVYQPLEKNRPYIGNQTLSDVSNINEFQQYLYGDSVSRIMFVRHPILRILSGFLEVARFRVFWTKIHSFQRNLGTTPLAFQSWVTSGVFRQHYHSTCNEDSVNKSLNRAIQHWAPPQHCRCGIHDCGIKWQVYKLEEHNGGIAGILSRYLPAKHLSNTRSNDTIHHQRSYNLTDYLTPEVLEILNQDTKEEQEFLGYKPLTVNNINKVN